MKFQVESRKLRSYSKKFISQFFEILNMSVDFLQLFVDDIEFLLMDIKHAFVCLGRNVYIICHTIRYNA